MKKVAGFTKIGGLALENGHQGRKPHNLTFSVEYLISVRRRIATVRGSEEHFTSDPELLLVQM
jgi:hypothetical protein